MLLTWYVNRLRAMGAAEIAHRVVEKAKKLSARRRLEGWKRYASPGPVPVLSGIAESFSRVSPAAKSEIERSALWVLSGKFEALGVTWPQQNVDRPFHPDIWRLDPVTGKLWSGASTYCFDISYRHERSLGDVKYVWEYNRLQFLQPVAAYACVTGSQEAIAFIEAAIASWYAANPPFRGLGWSSGIELALRAISLLIVTSLCGNLLSHQCIAQIRAILYAHQVWILRYPSGFSSANNHLIAEIAGLFLISCAMVELPDSAQLKGDTLQQLAEEIAKQILDDGVGAEQSPTYGAFTAEFVLLCSLVARASGVPIQSTIETQLLRFANFIWWLSNSDGFVPSICDDDEGRVVTLGRCEPTYAASVAAAIAGHYGKLQNGPRPHHYNLRDVLFGSPQTGGTTKLGLHTFAGGGYTVVREHRVGHEFSVILDHAPLGYLSIAAHGHADALSVIVSIDGELLFTDPGTYLYHSGGAWRNWFRGTAAHNTLNIEGFDQSVISGAFNWSHKAVAKLESVHHNGDVWSIVASHSGYLGRFGVVHRRKISSTSDGMAIYDQLIGDKTRRLVEIVFQLSPGWKARFYDGTVYITGKSEIMAELSFNQPGNVLIKEGGEVGEGGWVSETFGQKVAASRIVWKGSISEDGLKSTLKVGQT